MNLQTTRERKEKGRERGEKALIIFILPTLEKVLATHLLRHLDLAVPFSKIRVDIYLLQGSQVTLCALCS